MDNSNATTTVKYDEHKWKKIMDTTQCNYANMIKRLDRKQKTSNFILVYYSIFLIVTTLTGKYFPSYFHSTLAEYFGIILSVVLLAYSLINGSANYSIRIYEIENSLNKLKAIKRKLNTDNLDENIEKYNQITDATERRTDTDFFITVKHICKNFEISWITKKPINKGENVEGEEKKSKDENIKVINDYLSEINVIMEESKIIFEYIWYAILFVIPIILFILCIYVEIAR